MSVAFAHIIISALRVEEMDSYKVHLAEEGGVKFYQAPAAESQFPRHSTSALFLCPIIMGPKGLKVHYFCIPTLSVQVQLFMGWTG